LNERATQVGLAAAGSAGATISRLIECTFCGCVGQPRCEIRLSSLSRISHLISHLFFAENFERLLAEDAMAGEPACDHGECSDAEPLEQGEQQLEVVVEAEAVHEQRATQQVGKD